MSRSFVVSRPHRPRGEGRKGVVLRACKRRISVSQAPRIREIQLVKGAGSGGGVQRRHTPDQCPFDLVILNKFSRDFRTVAPQNPSPVPRAARLKGAERSPCPRSFFFSIRPSIPTAAVLSRELKRKLP